MITLLLSSFSINLKPGPHKSICKQHMCRYVLLQKDHNHYLVQTHVSTIARKCDSHGIDM